ncbi:MAG: ABC transporter ATP-binding protein [Planctomycetota bacterium]
MSEPPALATHTTGDHGASEDRRAVVSCQGLSKVFKDFWLRDRARAVDGVDFVVREREVFGLLGPNGSGKSTTIKLILGLLKPTGGRVGVFGKPPTDVSTKKRIGYLPEESYLYPFLNARETLDYYGKLFGIDPKTREKRIDELLDMVGLSHAQFRPVREYSKGMQRRIGIAQALINDPDLLILDEPTTGLDPIGTRQVKDLILDLGRRGKSIILSSHLLADVEDVVDRMVILYGGKIRGEGTCEQLLASHERTTIETDELDEGTIAEIDEIIRRRTGGEKSIRRVAASRQKLEELFLGIVERARAERTSTSGATEGGSTAAFLAGAGHEAEERGEAVIDRLLNPDEPEMPEPAPPSEPQQHLAPPDPEQGSVVQADASVIDSLVGGDKPEPTVPPEAPAGSSSPDPGVRGDVDQGMIGDLLGGSDSDAEEPGRDQEGSR